MINAIFLVIFLTYIGLSWGVWIVKPAFQPHKPKPIWELTWDRSYDEPVPSLGWKNKEVQAILESRHGRWEDPGTPGEMGLKFSVFPPEIKSPGDLYYNPLWRNGTQVQLNIAGIKSDKTGVVTDWRPSIPPKPHNKVYRDYFIRRDDGEVTSWIDERYLIYKGYTSKIKTFYSNTLLDRLIPTLENAAIAQQTIHSIEIQNAAYDNGYYHTVVHPPLDLTPGSVNYIDRI
jgi:hypothetical protein